MNHFTPFEKAIAVVIVIALILAGVLAYVAFHFISKFW